MRMLSLLVVVGVLGYAAAVGLIAWKQEALLFHPEPLAPDAALSNEPDVHERKVPVDGAELSVLELRLPAPRGVVFFLHGNGSNLRNWFVNTDFYRRAGFDLVMLDYRGYGKSTGRIASEAQLHADVTRVWAEVAPRYVGKKVVVYGRSLGTGLAAHLAAQIRPDLTMLVSPYLSMASLAAEHYPWVPQAVLRYPLRTDDVASRLDTPVVLIHGEQDTLIPISHSQRLQRITPRSRLITIPGAGHGDLQDFEPYRAAVREALARL